MCLVDAGETATAVVRQQLFAKHFDAVLIGAGIRADDAHFPLFERLVNAVYEVAPRARICFNSSPTDSTDAVLRWL